ERIAARLRSGEAHTQRAGGGVIELDDLSVDIAARRVTVEGSEIALRPKEFNVIRVLAESAGAAVTRERLIDEVWDENWWGFTKTLDVHINSIPRNLGEQAGA